jgi:ATP-dependent Clp protease ATP-binding subunit ClpA
MFERYTEKARRTIFFARYEASQFGPNICCWGCCGRNKTLVNRFLRTHAAVESIRKQIEGHTSRLGKVSTSVDLPLSQECKRVLTYGAEESERLHHYHIGTDHLLLGILRVEESFAAQLLSEQGLTLDSVREQVQESEAADARDGPAAIARLDQWLAEREARGGIWTVKRKDIPSRTIHFAIYASDQPKGDEQGLEMAPAEKLTQILRRIDFIVKRNGARHWQS